MRALVTCGCGSVPTYSQTRFKIQHPNDPIPKLYIGKHGYTLLETLPQDSEVQQFLSSILKKRGRYAYLIEWGDDGVLGEVFNYIKGTKLR